MHADFGILEVRTPRLAADKLLVALAPSVTHTVQHASRRLPLPPDELRLRHDIRIMEYQIFINALNKKLSNY
jgi:hypothetical protein